VTTAAQEAKRLADAAKEVRRLADRWPEEFRLGYRFGFRGKADPPCDQAGYPAGFHGWPLDRRNAWFAGWNSGFGALNRITADVGEHNG
jgi:hypothetical protein